MRGWLVKGAQLPDGNIIESLYVQQEQWQIFVTASGGYALAVSEQLHAFWTGRDLLEDGLLMPLLSADGTISTEK